MDNFFTIFLHFIEQITRQLIKEIIVWLIANDNVLVEISEQYQV